VIVRRLRLHPFGFFADRELAFGPGLTVVLGPNEAGKSTFFNALRNALFVPAGLARPRAAKYVDPFVPAAGGDTVRVDLDFETSGTTWRLAKSWGASPGCELRGPAGAVYTSDAAVHQALAGLLPARPGTCTAVLMAGQEELARTIESLQAERAEALADLSDILRAAVLETGGVSVDGFRSLLAARIDEAFSRNWDRERGGPRNGRGIENPWKKETGKVLDAWYARERARQALIAAREWERRLDEVNRRFRDASAAAAAQEDFVRTHAKAAADARERGRLEAEAGRARAEIAVLTQAAEEWPGALEKIRATGEALQELEAARAALEKERREAELQEGAVTLREKAERVARRKRAALEAREKLAAAPRIERKALEEVRGAARELERLQAGLEAGRLSVTVAGRKTVRVSTQEDFAAEAGQDLAAGSILRLRAAGRIRIVHPDMEIEVRSGDADAQARTQKAQAAEKRLAAALAAAGAANPADAESRWSVCEPLAADAAAAEKSLAEELDREALGAFEARVALLGPVRALRPLAVVSAELARCTAEASGKRRDLDALRGRVAGWETRHGSTGKLIGTLADLHGAEKAAVAEMDRRAPLPAGFADAQAFLRAWDDAAQRAQSLRAAESALAADRQVLAANPPDRSSEELVADLSGAEADFDSTLRGAQALERVARAADELAGGSDSAVTSVMGADLEATLSAMTSQRHGRVEMDGAVPRALAPAGGARLGRELLSVGTRDTLALALRLVMARHFLARTDGFLVMDDPLVDMDPGRQRAAAAVLRTFAADRQLVFFTCHPAAAEMLGGTLVEL
jgi:DNA repair protein SbcC/Rad50